MIPKNVPPTLAHLPHPSISTLPIFAVEHLPCPNCTPCTPQHLQVFHWGWAALECPVLPCLAASYSSVKVRYRLGLSLTFSLLLHFCVPFLTWWEISFYPNTLWIPQIQRMWLTHNYRTPRLARPKISEISICSAFWRWAEKMARQN